MTQVPIFNRCQHTFAFPFLLVCALSTHHSLASKCGVGEGTLILERNRLADHHWYPVVPKEASPVSLRHSFVHKVLYPILSGVSILESKGLEVFATEYFWIIVLFSLRIDRTIK